MFERPHHQRIARVLQALDADLLRQHGCLFGGGTCITLRFGEYRESVDMDFLISNPTGYRELRQILTSAQGMALDTFQVTLPEHVTVDDAFLAELNAQMSESMQKTSELRAPNLGRLPSRSRNFPIKPSMSLMPVGNDEYVLKLTATDRPGVLYSISYIFHEMNIKLRSARIVTLGERLEDVFVVYSPQLVAPNFAAELEHRIVTVCTI